MSLLPFPKEVDNRLSILEAVGTIYGKYTTTSTTTTFTIPESTFDPDKQELVLIYKNLSLTKDVNYTQSGKDITLAFSISAGEYIEYEIHKVASGGVPGGADYVIPDGTVTKVKLSVDVQATLDEVSKIGDLTQNNITEPTLAEAVKSDRSIIDNLLSGSMETSRIYTATTNDVETIPIGLDYDASTDILMIIYENGYLSSDNYVISNTNIVLNGWTLNNGDELYIIIKKPAAGNTSGGGGDSSKIGDLTANGITEPTLAEAIKNDRIKMDNIIGNSETNTFIASSDNVGTIPIGMDYDTSTDDLSVFYKNTQLSSDNYSIVGTNIVLNGWYLNNGDILIIKIDRVQEISESVGFLSKIGDLTANGITEPTLAEAIKNDRTRLDALAVNLVEIDNVYTATSDGISTIPIGSNYNATTDKLFLLYKNSYLVSDNYTINGTNIELSGWTLNNGESLTIQILKINLNL